MDKITIETLVQHNIDTDINTNNIIHNNDNNEFNSAQLLKNNINRRNKLYAKYNNYYLQCVNKIDSLNKMNKTDLIYSVPLLIFGEPDYNCKDCIDFIKYKLDKNKLYTIKISNITLFITWKFLEIDL